MIQAPKIPAVETATTIRDHLPIFSPNVAIQSIIVGDEQVADFVEAVALVSGVEPFKTREALVDTAQAFLIRRTRPADASHQTWNVVRYLGAPARMQVPLWPKPQNKDKLPNKFDASFWLLIEPFDCDLQVQIGAATAAIRSIAICPYFTVQYCDHKGICEDSFPCGLTDAEKPQCGATKELAGLGELALFNRFLLRDKAERAAGQALRCHKLDIMHFGLTIGFECFKLWKFELADPATKQASTVGTLSSRYLSNSHKSGRPNSVLQQNDGKLPTRGTAPSGTACEARPLDPSPDGPSTPLGSYTSYVMKVLYVGNCRDKKMVGRLADWINCIHSWGAKEYAQAVHRDVMTVHGRPYHPLGRESNGDQPDESVGGRGDGDMLADEEMTAWKRT